MTYLFTIIDRFTRWPEAIPLPDAKTLTCTNALIRGWISRFGVPADITSDRGPQFTSSLWSNLNKMLGIKQQHTTAYHPQANGMVERLHRQLKDSLKARTTSPHWMEHLPFTLLGLRTTWREELGCSPAELVYGSTLRVPGEFIDPTPPHPFLYNLQPHFFATCKNRCMKPFHHLRHTTHLLHPITHPLLAIQVSFTYESINTRHPCNDLMKDHTELSPHLRNFSPSM